MSRLSSFAYLGSCCGLTLLMSGCPADDVPADDEAGTETTADTGETTADTGETTADTGDTDGGGLCGNGDLDEGEECDDGNQDEGDGCSATCTVTSCGLVWTATSEITSATNGGFDTAVGPGGDVYTAGLKVGADNDAWVARYNADGLVWEATFDSGNGNEAANAIALGPDGELFVAGWMEADGDALWFARLDPATGAEMWSQTIDGDVMGEDDVATGIAVDGSEVVVVGRTRVAAGDDDVWVSKVSAADGSEVWTSTWTGPGDGMFSTDRSSAVAVDENGEIWVAAREHVDFETQDATVLHFGADGSFIELFQPQAGGSHQHDPIDIAVGGGAVYFAMQKGDFPYRGWLYKLDTAGAEQWVKTEVDWVTIGEDWAVRGIGLDQNGNLEVGGVFGNEEAGEGISWGEAWMARLDPAGEYLCRTEHQEDDGAVIPPSLAIDSAGSGSSGAMGMTGILSAGQGSAQWLWVGYFAE